MRSLLIGLLLTGCATLSQADAKKLADDAAGYAVCLNVCIANTNSESAYQLCAARCDAEFKGNHELVESRVLRALKAE